MGNVDVGHQQVVAADARDPVAFRRAAMNRYEFPNGIAIADFDAGGFAAVLQILGRESDRGKGKNPVVLADPGVAVDDRMGHHFCAFTEFDVLADQGVRTDRHAAGDLGVGMNNCRGMNVHGCG